MKAYRYRDDITGLRALAVLAIIANHFSHDLLPSGSLGVDVFFVISGFVITRSIVARATGEGFLAFLGGFYERRILRLGPALLACVAATSLLFSLLNAWPREGLLTGFAALFAASNLYLFYKSFDYFAQSAQLNPFTHTWSLGVEEQFYLLYPLLAYGLLFVPSVRRFRIFVPVIAGLAGISLAGYAIMHWRDPIGAFYLGPLRFWELALGCLLARLPEGFGARARGGAVIAAISLLALLACLAAPLPTHPVQMAVAVTASGALLASGDRLGPTTRIFCSRPAQYLGRISYSLYLWHWPVLALARLSIGVSPWIVPILIALILLLADQSYRHLERRFTGRQVQGGALRKTARYAAFPAAVGAAILIFAYPLEGSLFAGQRAALEGRGPDSMERPYRSSRGGIWKGRPCILTSNLDAGREIDLADCTIGHPDASRRLLVLGSSYATAFLPALVPMADGNQYRVSLLASYGAAPAPGGDARAKYALSNEDFWQRIAPQATAKLKPGDAVLLISALNRYAPGRPSTRDDTDRGRYAAHLVHLSRELGSRGIGLAVLWGVPFLGEAQCNPEQALPQWFAPGARKCRYLTRQETEQRMRPLEEDLRRLERRGDIVLVGVLDALCPGDTCGFLAPDGTVLYRDEYGHVSIEGARKAADLIVRQLEPAFRGTKPARDD